MITKKKGKAKLFAKKTMKYKKAKMIAKKKWKTKTFAKSKNNKGKNYRIAEKVEDRIKG